MRPFWPVVQYTLLYLCSLSSNRSVLTRGADETTNWWTCRTSLPMSTSNASWVPSVFSRGLSCDAGCILTWRRKESPVVVTWTLSKVIIPVFTKIIGHVGHFRWLDPNVWWEISQFRIEFIKPIRQMSDEPWKFFGNTVMPTILMQRVYNRPFLRTKWVH